MSDPIRKVGGTSASTPEPTGTEASSFRASLDATASASSSAPATDIAASLRAGSMSAQQAVEALIERALSAPAARGLTDAGRADLARHLRNALAEDPTLRALQADLSSDSVRGEGRG